VRSCRLNFGTTQIPGTRFQQGNKVASLELHRRPVT